MNGSIPRASPWAAILLFYWVRRRVLYPLSPSSLGYENASIRMALASSGNKNRKKPLAIV